MFVLAALLALLGLLAWGHVPPADARGLDDDELHRIDAELARALHAQGDHATIDALGLRASLAPTPPPPPPPIPDRVGPTPRIMPGPPLGAGPSGGFSDIFSGRLAAAGRFQGSGRPGQLQATRDLFRVLREGPSEEAFGAPRGGKGPISGIFGGIFG